MSGDPNNILKRILIYGFGNPGRKDDGLGIAFAEQMEKWSRRKGIKNIDFDSNYQLNIEDAYVISKYDLVLFADASLEPVDQYKITFVEPSPHVNFSMHSISPSYVAYLCRELYNRKPLIFLLHIKGYEWELEEGITPKASNNLKKAISFTHKLFKNLDLYPGKIKTLKQKQMEII